MSRKKKQRRRPDAPPGRLPAPPAPFAAGNRVRVKAGVRDPDFPDTPLDGWAGIVADVDTTASPTLFLIAWDRRTLDAFESAYRERCEDEGLDLETMWLGADALEPDTGGQADVAPPAAPAARLLYMDDEEDRVRSVFGLGGDDPLPPVNEDTLRRYHDYLAPRLRFPLAALYTESLGAFRERTVPVLALRLLPPDEADPDDGLLVEVAQDAPLGPPGTPGDNRAVLPLAELRLSDKDPGNGLVLDYVTWLECAPFDGPDDEPVPADFDSGPPSLWRLALPLVVFGAVGGAVVGAVLETVSGARIGVLVGAGALATLGALAGRRYGILLGAVNRFRLGGAFGAVGGALVGALAGALVGAWAVAFVGSILGSIAGTLLKRVLRSFGARWLGEISWALLGACTGSLILAWYEGPPGRFLPAALLGAALGALLVLLVAVSFLLLMAVLMGFRR